ncbi:MAG: penicillin-binding transpeptidase domain-containing protein, partial [Pseudomonadales bacterium]
ETLNIGIGQGYMLATPLQLAVATATIANRGGRPVPQLVKQIPEGKIVYDNTFTIDDSYWDQIIDGMEAVVHDRVNGTARSIGRGINYRIAGKSGTAQVVGIAQGEEYDEDAITERQRDHALFVGFAPIDNPQVAVAVIIENAGGGSTHAAPVARKVFDWVLEANARKQQEASEL